ncbi:MAG: WYL domain-containing protein [Bacteroides sp.]|nr:WYL domain-containing protein [Roseburia sp.]MCM1346170.1 WYL domain-containing protein [Bacteroides sp.]MCM1420973.1 WYL domain-containing protein [Bacteroides sp.]
MANVKNGAFREIIIDRCLQSRQGYSTMEIMRECNAALERRCEPLVTAPNTIRNDILSIENRWNIVVEPLKDGRNIKYRYKDPKFSIFNCSLNENEILQLNQAVSLLRRFEGMPGFGWVDELNAHLQSTINAEQKCVIGFDENKQLKGMEFFTPLFESISRKEVIKVIYQSYNEDAAKTYVVHPYYLKEYNRRWFLFALNKEYDDITIFSLDRIQEVRKISAPFIENDKVDFEHYFNEIIGVSSNKHEKLTLIVLLVSAEQLPYILTKPLHHTQEVREYLQDGNAILSIMVKPNFELIQELLSFGDRITVLEPKAIRERIKVRIENNLKNYQ